MFANITGEFHTQRRAEQLRTLIDNSWNDWTCKKRCSQCHAEFRKCEELFRTPQCKLHPMPIRPSDVASSYYIGSGHGPGHYACCGTTTLVGDHVHCMPMRVPGCLYVDHTTMKDWFVDTKSKAVTIDFFPDNSSLVSPIASRLEMIPVFIIENLIQNFGDNGGPFRGRLERTPSAFVSQLKRLLHRPDTPDGTPSLSVVTSAAEILTSDKRSRQRVLRVGMQNVRVDIQQAYLAMTYEYGLESSAFQVGSGGSSNVSDTAVDDERIDDLMDLLSPDQHQSVLGRVANAQGSRRERMVTDYSYYNPQKNHWEGVTRDAVGEQVTRHEIEYAQNDPWGYAESDESNSEEMGEDANRSAIHQVFGNIRGSLDKKSFYPFVIYSWFSSEIVNDEKSIDIVKNSQCSRSGQ